MAVELKSRGVTSVSLWPGAVQTELVSQFILDKNAPQDGNSVGRLFSDSKSISMIATSVFFFFG